ncbi:MAG: TonB-dependent receptor [Ignavibacteriales bacterium]|nr:TonB-dependent receptor [Ignavibacteriales bacterium]
MKLIATLLLLFCLFTGLEAQTEQSAGKVEVEVISLEDLLKMGIEVASFTQKNIFNTPSTVSVIDKETIKRYNFTSIAEALNYVSGFSVTRSYLKRNIPTSRGILQDNYANKVLVMINGTPAWHASTGEGNLDRVNIADVERIEVLKGPASVLYGTNAYSGAVNIVIKKANGTSSAGRFKYGENGLISGGGNFSFNKDDYSVFVSANSTNERGSDFRFVDQVNVAGNVKQYIKTNNFTVNLGYKAHGLLFNAYNVDESYLGVTPRFSSGAGKNHNLNGYMFNYSFENSFSKEFHLNADVTLDWEQRVLSRTFDDETRADIVGQRLSGVVNALYQATDQLSFQLGTEYAKKKSIKYDNISVQKGIVLEDNYMSGKSIYDFSLFGQTEFNFAPFDILAGVRYNKNELFGGNVSSRATLVYSIDSKNALKLVYGTSYRSPSLFELYFRTSTNTVFGNTKLQPEESTSFELSYVTSFGNFFLQALAYYADYTNKIFRTTGTVILENGTSKNNVSIYTNGKKFSAKGFELDGKYQLTNNFDALFNYSYVSGDNGDEVAGVSHYNFKYVPRHTAVVGLSKQFGDLSFSGLANYISERGSVKTKIGSSVVIDFNIGFTQKIGGYNLRHNLSAKNLFNKTILFPEYVSRALNDIPSGYARQIFYSLTFEL